MEILRAKSTLPVAECGMSAASLRCLTAMVMHSMCRRQRYLGKRQSKDFLPHLTFHYHVLSHTPGLIPHPLTSSLNAPALERPNFHPTLINPFKALTICELPNV